MLTKRAAGLLVGLIVAVGLITAALLLINVRDGLSPLELLYLRWQLARQETALTTPLGTDTTPRIFTIVPGSTAVTIGADLAASGLIADAALFRTYVRYNGLDSQLEAGTYFVNPAQTIPEIALLLTDSSQSSIPFRVLEGWRREEIAQAIDANPLFQFTGADFLSVTGAGAEIPPEFAAYVGLPPGAPIEGFLYPDTYALPPEVTATGLRDTLLESFQARVDPALQAAADQAGFSLYESVTLASIVEREAVIQSEQPLIASVYLNRLTIGMTLDADPTVQYGIGYREGAWWPSITQADYRTAISPYNTYLNPGLPPGPIANPALPAIRATIFPAESPYTYFRTTCAQDGYHVFATTFEEHVANGVCP